MASGNKVFRAVRTYFLNGVKVPVGSLVREGHAVMQGVEHHFQELKIDFEREDIQAQKDAKAAADKAAVELEAKAEVEMKAAEESAAKTVEADAAKVAEQDAVKAVETEAKKAVS